MAINVEPQYGQIHFDSKLEWGFIANFNFKTKTKQMARAHIFIACLDLEHVNHCNRRVQ